MVMFVELVVDLSRFICYLKPIKEFLDEKLKNYPELKDENWLLKFMFLTA